jgi:hypothetical protein
VPTIALPTKDRTLEPYVTGEPIVFPSKEQTQSFNRIAYAAAHVVAAPPSTGRRPSRFGTICGTSASASPKRWTRRSAAAGSVGARPSN